MCVLLPLLKHPIAHALCALVNDYSPFQRPDNYIRYIGALRVLSQNVLRVDA